jgi:hypothetical protein
MTTSLIGKQVAVANKARVAWIAAAASPAALGLSVLFLVVGFVGMRLRKGESVSLPAAVAFYGGAVGGVMIQQLAIGS